MKPAALKPETLLPVPTELIWKPWNSPVRNVNNFATAYHKRSRWLDADRPYLRLCAISSGDLFNVLGWMMTIPPGLQNQIAARIAELNRSKDMPFESLMVRLVKDQVRKECMEEGRRDVLRRQLQLRFGPLPESVEQRIDRAEPGELTAWVEKILHAVILDDVIGES